MSGEGRGQWRGCRHGGHGSGGCGSCSRGSKSATTGNGNSNNGNNGKGTGEQKKIFEPHHAGKHQVDTHDSVKEQIIVQVQKNFKNAEKIVSMLQEEDEKKIELTKPTLTKELFVDASGMTLKDEAKMTVELKQEENNTVQ